MKALDLYAGLGAFSLALREAGLEIAAAAERDPWRAAAYREHFPGVPCYVEADDAIRAHPEAELWTACAGVAELARLVGSHTPRWLWLESVREPFGAITEVVSRRYPAHSVFDACGRRHLVAGPVVRHISLPAELPGLQHPDRDKRQGKTWEQQEAALGLPEGWTAAAGATPQQRHGAIASASNMAVLRAVARAIVEAT